MRLRYRLDLPWHEAVAVEHPHRVDRYGRIERWARRRYANADGSITTRVGRMVAGGRAPALGSTWAVPTRYAVIEDLAAFHLLGHRRHWPGETLATAYAPARVA